MAERGPDGRFLPGNTLSKLGGTNSHKGKPARPKKKKPMQELRSRGSIEFKVILTGLEFDLVHQVLNQSYRKADANTRRRLSNILTKIESAPRN